MYPCVPAHVTEYTEAASTALKGANKGYKHRGSNVHTLHGGGSAHVSLPYDYSSESSSHIQDKMCVGWSDGLTFRLLGRVNPLPQ